MALKVLIRPAAEADLQSLYEYIAQDSPQSAIEFVRRIRSHCTQLGEFAERGTRRDDLEAGIRTLGFERRALLVFRVLDGEVEILRILYGGRDLDRLFTQGHGL